MATRMCAVAGSQPRLVQPIHAFGKVPLHQAHTAITGAAAFAAAAAAIAECSMQYWLWQKAGPPAVQPESA